VASIRVLGVWSCMKIENAFHLITNDGLDVYDRKENAVISERDKNERV
jgi:hypothetical protein